MSPDPGHTAVLAFGVIVPATVIILLALHAHDRRTRAVERVADEHALIRAARLGAALDEHPGRDRFLKMLESWQILAAAGPTPMPTVAEMIDLGLSPADAQTYVDEWDPTAEYDAHRDRVALANFAEIIVARAALYAVYAARVPTNRVR